jgi:hypothetical protein
MDIFIYLNNYIIEIKIMEDKRELDVESEPFLADGGES